MGFMNLDALTPAADLLLARQNTVIDFLSLQAPAFKLKRAEDGRISASLFRCEIGSHFQPLVEAARNSRVFGHQTRLSAREQADKSLSLNEMLDIARSCDVLAQLQWLDVALHVANYFVRAPTTYTLFVSPAAEVFDDITAFATQLGELLSLLQIAPQRLVVRIPDKLLASVKATGPLLEALKQQGLGIAVGLPKRFDLLKKLEQLHRIGFVLFDPSKRARESNINQLIRQINSIGSMTVCTGILDPRNNDKLAEAGAGLLIGHGIAPPSAHIFPGLLPPFPWARV